MLCLFYHTVLTYRSPMPRLPKAEIGANDVSHQLCLQGELWKLPFERMFLQETLIYVKSS